MRRDRPSPSALGGSAALPTSCPAFWPPEMGEDTFLVVTSLELCNGSPGLIYVVFRKISQYSGIRQAGGTVSLHCTLEAMAQPVRPSTLRPSQGVSPCWTCIFY